MLVFRSRRNRYRQREPQTQPASAHTSRMKNERLLANWPAETDKWRGRLAHSRRERPTLTAVLCWQPLPRSAYRRLTNRPRKRRVTEISTASALTRKTRHWGGRTHHRPLSGGKSRPSSCQYKASAIVDGCTFADWLSANQSLCCVAQQRDHGNRHLLAAPMPLTCLARTTRERRVGCSWHADHRLLRRRRVNWWLVRLLFCGRAFAFSALMKSTARPALRGSRRAGWPPHLEVIHGSVFPWNGI